MAFTSIYGSSTSYYANVEYAAAPTIITLTAGTQPYIPGFVHIVDQSRARPDEGLDYIPAMVENTPSRLARPDEYH